MTAAANAAPFFPQVTPEYQARLALAQLEALRMARDATVNMIDKIDRGTAGLLEPREDHPMSGTVDLCQAFNRTVRTLRQIIVLEQEVAGLREPPRRYYAVRDNDAAPKAAAPRDAEDRAERDDDHDDDRDDDYERDDLRDAPDRDDTHDDYDDREFDVVLASLRKTLDKVARELPFEERKRVVAEAEALDAKVRVKTSPSGETSPNAAGIAPTPGKGSRSPPDTG